MDPIVTMDPLVTPEPIANPAHSRNPILNKLLSDFRIVMHEFVRALFGLPSIASEEAKK